MHNENLLLTATCCQHPSPSLDMWINWGGRASQGFVPYARLWGDNTSFYCYLSFLRLKLIRHVRDVCKFWSVIQLRLLWTRMKDWRGDVMATFLAVVIVYFRDCNLIMFLPSLSFLHPKYFCTLAFKFMASFYLNWLSLHTYLYAQELWNGNSLQVR